MLMRQLMITGFILLGMVSFAEAQEPIKGDSLQEVVVTGTGTHHLLRTAPVQTEVITRRDLEQYGGRSIEEILNGLSASFSFNEDDMGSQMQMNGLGNSYIALWLRCYCWRYQYHHTKAGKQSSVGKRNAWRIVW